MTGKATALTFSPLTAVFESQLAGEEGCLFVGDGWLYDAVYWCLIFCLSITGQR